MEAIEIARKRSSWKQNYESEFLEGRMFASLQRAIVDRSIRGRGFFWERLRSAGSRYVATAGRDQ